MKIIEKGYKNDIQACSRNGATTNLFKVGTSNLDNISAKMLRFCIDKNNLEKIEYQDYRHKSYILSDELIEDLYVGFESSIEVYTPYTAKSGRLFKNVESGSPTFDKFISRIRDRYEELAQNDKIRLIDFYFDIYCADNRTHAKVTLDDIPQVDLIEDDGVVKFRTYYKAVSGIMNTATLICEKGVYKYDMITGEESFEPSNNKIAIVAKMLEIRLGRSAEKIYRQYVEMFCKEILMQTVTYRIAIPKKKIDVAIQEKVDSLLNSLSRLNKVYFTNKNIRELIIIHNELYLIKQKYQ